MAAEIENIEDDWLTFLDNAKVGNIALNTENITTNALQETEDNTKNKTPKRD